MMTNGWQVHRIGDLLTQNSNNVKVAPDKSYKLLGISLEGRGAFLREEKTGDSISATTLSPVHVGDFIYSRLFAWRGAFDIVSEELNGCFVSNEFPTFKINTEILLPKFLRLYFNRKIVWEEVEKYCTGTTKASRNRFKEQFFLGMEVPLPPLTEQRRIVEHIESLAARVNEAQSLREEAGEEADSLVHSALNAIFNDAFAQKHPNHLLGDVADIRSGVTLGRTLQGNTVRLPYLRVANVQDGYFDLRQIKEIEVLESEKDKWQLQRGDVLLTEGGDWDKLGRGAVWNEEIQNCIHQNHIFRVRINQDEFVPEYLAMLIGSPYGKNYFRAASKQTTNLASINHRQLKAFTVIRPPLDEQRRIVAYLDGLQAKVNALRELQSRSGEELSALMPSVLDRAFKGEL